MVENSGATSSIFFSVSCGYVCLINVDLKRVGEMQSTGKHCFETDFVEFLFGK